MTKLDEMPSYVREAYARLVPGSRLIRTSSDSEEAVLRGGGYLYSVEPGSKKFPTASGKALIDAQLVAPQGDGLLPEVSQTFVAAA